MRVCFTGWFTLNGKWVSRSVVKKQLEDAGHVCVSSVNGKTDLLLIGKHPPNAEPTAKENKAFMLGVPAVDCDEAMILLYGGGALLDNEYVENL